MPVVLETQQYQWTGLAPSLTITIDVIDHGDVYYTVTPGGDKLYDSMTIVRARIQRGTWVLIMGNDAESVCSCEECKNTESLGFDECVTCKRTFCTVCLNRDVGACCYCRPDKYPTA